MILCRHIPFFLHSILSLIAYHTNPLSPSRKLPVRSANPVSSQANARAKALETPRVFNRARIEGGPTSYTIVPKSNIQIPDQVRRAPGAAGDEAFRRMRAKQLGKSGRGGR